MIHVVRGIRGATTVEDNSAENIKEATTELLEKIVEENNIHIQDIVSIIFTVTSDLDADFPASSARGLGWHMVPLICTTEISVPGALKHCIRVLMHINTDLKQSEIRHVYLRKAVSLRQDLAAQ